MIPNFTINWQEKNPIWMDFENVPLFENIHIVKVHIPKHIAGFSERADLLAESELIKLDRILRQEDKDIFLASSVMKKILCGIYLNCSPDEIKFVENENKKPQLSNQPKLHFNTSHSGDWLLFIFSRYPCGIDIEKIQWDFDFYDVMEFAFHKQEKDFVLKSDNLQKSFFRIWTIKESLLKATGEGLIDNLHQLNMLQVQSLLEKNDPWQINSFLVGGDYWCSICFKNPDPAIKFFEF